MGVITLPLKFRCPAISHENYLLKILEFPVIPRVVWMPHVILLLQYIHRHIRKYIYTYISYVSTMWFGGTEATPISGHEIYVLCVCVCVCVRITKYLYICACLMSR